MKKILFSIMMLVMAGQMMAVPAYRGWVTKTQPDGTTIVIRQSGDEFYHFWENEEGLQMEEDEQGYWHVVGESPTPAAVASRRAENRMYRSKKAAMAEGDGPHKVGEKNLAPRGLVILVNFTDKQYQDINTPAAMNEMMNGDNYTYNGAMGSARKYFSDQSNGQYVPEFDVIGPVTVKKNYAYYGKNVGSEGNDAYVVDMIVEACKEADKLGVDFTKYNNDGDQFVDFVYVIYAGKGEADGGAANTIWPHNWNAYSAAYYSEHYGYDYTTYKTDDLLFDGLYIDNYACSGELGGTSGKRNGIGVICHEFGHVLGLPDFYDTEYGTNYKYSYTPGEWDVMDAGSYNDNQNCPPNYSAWEKYFFGWATPRCLKDKGDYTLTTDYSDIYQLNSNGSLANWNSTATQYYIENRQQTGWDTYLPGHGMLIWQVTYNQDAWDNNEPNNTANKPKYKVVSASGKAGMQGAADPFPGTSKVTSKTLISGKPIKDIVESNKQIKFTFIEAATSYTYYILAEHATVSSEEGTVAKGQTFSVTITPEADYTIGEAELDVRMGGAKLTMGTGYSYNNNVLSISNVSGNIEIMVEPKKVSTNWSAWTDFAPKGYATGTYTFNVVLNSGTEAQTDIPVKIRTNLDDSKQHEIKMCNWGKGVLSDNGVDIIIEWNEQTNACRVKKQYSGWTSSSYGEVYIGDITAWQEKDYSASYPCTYDPTTCTFTLSVAYYIADGRRFGYSGDDDGHTTETLQMNLSPVPPMDYDEKTNIEVAFTTDEIVGTETDGTEIYIKAIKADNSYMLSLYFFANSTDADIVIPAGEYTFSKSEAAGTVLISEGVVDNSVNPSFLATTDGVYVNNLWFPVAGKVTVEKVIINGKKKIYMELDAINSYGATVKATVGSKPMPTAIQEVVEPSRAVKTLENGQLLIHREGKIYNAVGTKWADK